MEYQYASRSHDWSLLSSGRILFSRPGLVGFPPRLASELFQRCVASLKARGGLGPHLVFDPCCGAGNSLTAIGLLHGDVIQTIVGSDVSEDALGLCARNLTLLQREGLEQRIQELRAKGAAFNRPHYEDAALAAERLGAQVGDRLDRPPITKLFRADAADVHALREGLGDLRPDIVMADLPYGVMSHSQSSAGLMPDAWRTRMMEVVLAVAARPAALAIVSSERARTAAAGCRWRRLKLGKRHILLGEA